MEREIRVKRNRRLKSRMFPHVWQQENRLTHVCSLCLRWFFKNDSKKYMEVPRWLHLRVFSFNPKFNLFPAFKKLLLKTSVGGQLLTNGVHFFRHRQNGDKFLEMADLTDLNYSIIMTIWCRKTARVRDFSCNCRSHFEWGKLLPDCEKYS